MPPSMSEDQRRLRLLGKLLGLPGLGASQTALAQDVLKPQAPHMVSDTTSHVFSNGQFLPVPGGGQPVQEPPPREGYQRTYTQDPRGKTSYSDKPRDANLGERRESRIHAALKEAGWSLDMPGYPRAFLNVEKQIPVEGVGVFGQGQLVVPPPPRGAPGAAQPTPVTEPILKVDKPIEAAAAQLVVGAAAARKASQAVLTALKDKTVRDYIGPYGQYLSTVQGKAPFEALGKIPPSVVALEQNLARVKNYTIKLITGAQMSEPEAKRIMQELPDLGQQPDVLAQRMAATDANNAMMEGLVRDLVMRGNQKSAAIAKELGLDVSAKLGGPAGVGNAAPPTGGWKIERVK